MNETLSEFLVQMTRRAAANLEAAYLRLPEDRRRWSPGGAAAPPPTWWPNAPS